MTSEERSLNDAAFSGAFIAARSLLRRGTDPNRARAWNALLLGWCATSFSHREKEPDGQVALLRSMLEILLDAGMRCEDDGYVPQDVMVLVMELRAEAARRSSGTNLVGVSADAARAA